MRSLFALGLSFGLSLVLLHTASAGVLIDDFTSFPAGDSPTTFTAPNLGKNTTFLRQAGLDPQHVLGGARSASLSAYTAIPITTTFAADQKLCRIFFDSLCTGVAELSYKGGGMGEAMNLDADLKAGGAQAIFVYFTNAPAAGTLMVTVYSKDKFQTFALPIKDAKKPSVIPFSAFDKIDFAHIDGLTFEIQIPREINKKLTYEIARIDTEPLGK